MIVSAASRIVSAISFGVFCRLAPSTRLIIRSRNVWPRSAVIRTTIRSESTLVPPVTADRSPPDSRMTGADSPVIADSSIDATPSMISPSEGMTSPASHTTRSPLARLGGRDPLLGPVRGRSRRASVSVRIRRSVSACALPRPSATASAKLANSTVSGQPDGDRPVEHARVGDRLDQRDHGADQHDEHDRVLDLDPGIELPERVDRGLPQDLAIEQAGPAGAGRRRCRRCACTGLGRVHCGNCQRQTCR